MSVSWVRSSTLLCMGQLGDALPCRMYATTNGVPGHTAKPRTPCFVHFVERLDGFTARDHFPAELRFGKLPLPRVWMNDLGKS